MARSPMSVRIGAVVATSVATRRGSYDPVHGRKMPYYGGGRGVAVRLDEHMHVRMSEKIRNGPERDTSIDQVGGTGMAQA